MQVEIVRTEYNKNQTTGQLTVYEEDKVVFECKTLELPWFHNRRFVSCIPEGTYQVKRRHSQTFKDHFHILEVPGRSYILIHPGNYFSQTKGCILVGSEFDDINRDGIMDVVNSRETMGQLLDILPAKFQLTIKKSDSKNAAI